MPTAKQFDLYIEQLMTEIKSFPDNVSIWDTMPGIANSPGNLGLHIAGNLKHFVGAVMGKTGYVRERELEFSKKNLPVSEVLTELESARIIVSEVLSGLSEADMLQPYPAEFKGRTASINEALSHLFGHLTYHTGQVNYFRRIATSK